MPDTKENYGVAQQFGLSPQEYETLKERLGHQPGFIELALFSAIGLENKSSSKLIESILSLPKTGNQIDLLSPSANEYLVHLDENLSCLIKIESNDLPFKAEPFYESAYCMAMAVRHVIAAGTVPIAGLNNFNLGLPETEGNIHISEDFINGIGEIGNSAGFPIVGAKVSFEKCFNNSPELNTMVVGIKENDAASDSVKFNEQNVFVITGDIKPEIYKGNKISCKADLDSIKEIKIIGDHAGLNEKILHESTLEANQTGSIAGIKVVDRNGIILSIIQLAKTISKGIHLDLNKIAQTSDEHEILRLLLSGQIAKLLLIIEKGKEKTIEKIYSKWNLNLIEIGSITDDDKITILSGSKTLAEIPVSFFENQTINDIQLKSQQKETKTKLSHLKSIPLPENLKEVAWFLIKHPNIASKRWIHEQYDSMAGVGNMSTNFVSDAILINLKGTNQALALCMTGNQKHIKADPSIGAQIAVASAARRIACSGAKPLAVAPSISFINIHQADDVIVFNEFIDGLKKACNKFKIPVVNENIKFNTSSDNINQPAARCPGLNIGMLGLLEDKNHQMTISFKNKGNIIFLIGPSREEIAASEYLVSYHKKNIDSPPFFDLELEYKIQSAVQELIKKNYICSAHNVSRGGLFISLVESAMVYEFGFDIITDTDIRLDAFLFGESQGRVLVSINPNKESQFIDLMMKKDIPFLALGHVTKGEMRIDDISFGFIHDAKRAYENSLEKIIKK